MELLRPGEGPAGAGSGFWDSRAGRFASRFKPAAEDDVYLRTLLRLVRPEDTVVDVGAGTGRFAVPLAAHVREVVAVDPSERMLEVLNDHAEDRGAANLRTVCARWEDLPQPPTGDVTLCSFVLPVIEDAAGFVRRLDAATGRRGVIFLSGASCDLIHEPFWRYFHGRRRAPEPTFLNARDLMAELGLDVEVTVVEAPVTGRFESLDEAVDDFRENLLLEDSGHIREELAALLDAWLVADGDDLRVPLQTTPGAVLTWSC